LIRSQCGKPEHVWRDRNLREAELFTDDPRSWGQGALKKINQVFNRSAGVLKFGFGDLATDRAAMDIPIEPSGTPLGLPPQFRIPRTVAELWEDVSDHGELDDRREPLVTRIGELANSRRL